jgi:hypothetical protein
MLSLLFLFFSHLSIIPIFHYSVFRGGIAKWLRQRSAKPLFIGSNPIAASSRYQRSAPKAGLFAFRALLRYLLPAAYFFELTPEQLGSKENKIPSVSPLQRGGHMFGFPLL